MINFPSLNKFLKMSAINKPQKPQSFHYEYHIYTQMIPWNDQKSSMIYNLFILHFDALWIKVFFRLTSIGGWLLSVDILGSVEYTKFTRAVKGFVYNWINYMPQKDENK